MGRLMISATHRSSGKTMLTVGLCAALTRRGHAVQSFKKGPDFIDPLWLSAATGRPCRNLDFHTMSPDEIRAMASRHMATADLGLVEGTMGLHDGVTPEGGDSNVDLAALLGTPVVLVVNCRGMSRGIAPLLLGTQQFDPDLRIAGVVLNRVAGSRHEDKLRAAIERYTDIPVLGVLRNDPALAIDERHLGLIPSFEVADARSHIDALADAVESGVEIDRLLAAAASAPTQPPAAAPIRRRADSDVTIGLARDAAFGFYYPDDLDALVAAGVRLVPFDTLNDAGLPPVDGLFIGGGFPEMHMAALSANIGLRRQIASAVRNGLPTYAECGGLVYLARSLAWNGERTEMVGAIDADAVMQERPQGRGYVRLEETESHPWPTPAAGRHGAPQIAAHEFHHCRLTNLPKDATFAYRVRRGHGIDGEHDGLVQGNLLAGFAHLRDTDRHGWAGRFVDFVRACKAARHPTEERITA